MVVVLVIGVPMWWKTTEVYRVPLPYNKIESLSEMYLVTSIKIAIFTFDPNYSKLLIDELNSHYKNNGKNELWNINFIHVSNIENAQNFKTPASLESKILKSINLNVGDFLLYEWSKLLDDDILITSDRSALITNTTTSTKIIKLLDLYILQTYKIRNIIDEQNFGYKTSSPQPEYDIILSLLVPLPEKIDVQWDIRLASEIFLKPFLDNVNEVSNFILKSQWKYQMGSDFPVKQIKTNSTFDRYFAVSKDTLPHIITSIEKNIGQSISDNSCINIIVYIPQCDIAPLYIHDENDKIVSGNNISSFISPKWGSVIIYNPPENLCLMQQKTTEKIQFQVNTNDVMQTMLYHLQNLLDIHTEVQVNGIKVADNEQLAPRIWEYDSYIRRSAINHLFTANRTLRSLIQLLDNISYIVINDDVGKSITNAYDKIIEAKEYLSSGQLLTASKAAKEAFVSSERAFFDASLLAQLYFPDEQKYAVYIPLFLPIMVPVITSIATLKKYWKRSTNEKIKIT